MYKHIAITSTLMKWLERRGQIKHPLDPSLGNELIAKPMTWFTRHESPHRVGLSVKWSNGRVAPGPCGCGRTVWCQRILCAPCLPGNMVATNQEWRPTQVHRGHTHTNSAGWQEPRGRWKDRLHISYQGIQCVLLCAWQSGSNVHNRACI